MYQARHRSGVAPCQVIEYAGFRSSTDTNPADTNQKWIDRHLGTAPPSTAPFCVRGCVLLCWDERNAPTPIAVATLHGESTALVNGLVDDRGHRATSVPKVDTVSTM